ncbi:T9SS C-terminal target domain-containing protein [bacterium]|nr:T9SS type A sorting domain-containing protein [bacterium]RQV99607.1 MAG: T9SS C-terminal target domain-containing protein [bacterium]
MPIIAWQPSSEGAEWFSDDGGNACIQVYIDTSSAIPPYPIIEVSVASLNFGQVLTGTSSPLSFWVNNRGNLDDLVISGFSYTPPSFSNSYVFDQATYTIAALDSQEVTLTFSPTIESVYNGRVVLNNNSHNDQAYQILLLGSGVIEAVTDPATGLPTEFELSQNYPNPFNPATEIQFALPHDANVNLTVSNLLGQQVATAASGFYSAGFHTVTFSAANLPSGLYFYKLEAADFTAIRKMMLLK